MTPITDSLDCTILDPISGLVRRYDATLAGPPVNKELYYKILMCVHHTSLHIALPVVRAHCKVRCRNAGSLGSPFPLNITAYIKS